MNLLLSADGLVIKSVFMSKLSIELQQLWPS